MMCLKHSEAFWPSRLPLEDELLNTIPSSIATLLTLVLQSDNVNTNDGWYSVGNIKEYFYKTAHSRDKGIVLTIQLRFVMHYAYYPSDKEEQL